MNPDGHKLGGMLMLVGLFFLSTQAKADPVQDCAQTQDPSAAVQACSQLLPLVSADDQVAAVRLLRGSAYLRLKDFDSAITDLSEAIRARPGDAQAYVFRATAYQERERLSEAASDLDHAIQLKPEMAAQLTPHLVAIRYQLGMSMLENKNYPEAIAAFSEVIRLKPDAAEAYARRAIAYQNSGDANKGEADLAEAVRMKPELATSLRIDVGVLHRQRGRTLEQQGDLKGALAEYNQAIEVKPDAWGNYWLRGFLYRRAKRFGEAEADLRKAEEILERVAPADYESIQPDLTMVRNALAALPQDLEMDQRWIRYLKRIQDQGRYQNWPSPPYDLYKHDHALQ